MGFRARITPRCGGVGAAALACVRLFDARDREPVLHRQERDRPGSGSPGCIDEEIGRLRWKPPSMSGSKPGLTAFRYIGALPKSLPG